MSFQIDEIRLRQVKMPLVHFFETSFGRTYERDMVLVEVVSDGLSGWGEVTAGENPFYNEEWTESAWMIVRDYVAPRVLRHPLETPRDVAPRFKHIRGHKMACGGLEVAVWDLEARRKNIPLHQLIGGGARTEIPSGVSLGIQDTVDDVLRVIEKELAAGYQRIKMKIKPGRDIEDLREVRKRFPHIKLMADANSAYTLQDADRLQALDEFYLMMIEQPLAHDEIIDHVELQARLQTPICLDECIRSAHHAEQAIRLHACGIINIKLGRVGGFSEAIKVHDVCQQHNIPVWCGGMLESGIGRAHNIALASLPNFVLPGDVSASQRYWKRELLTQPIEATPHGTIAVPTGVGFGFDIDFPFLDSITVRQEIVR
jgi:O-succinylbenzoate synthase